MDEVEIETLKHFLVPSIIEWLQVEEKSTSAFVDNGTNVDEFLDNLPEAELAILDSRLEEKSSSTSEFKTIEVKELKRLVEKKTLTTTQSVQRPLGCSGTRSGFEAQR